MFINEAYFGKPKKCLEMEKCIHRLREKYGNDSIIGGQGIGVVEQSEDWINLRTLIEDQFGFYSVTLILMRDTSPNACTIPITITFDGVLEAQKNARIHNGIKYTKDAKYCTLIMVTEGLFFNKEFTDGEVLAVMLHEVGHNFDAAISRQMTPFTFIDLGLSLISGIMNMDQSVVIQFFTSFTKTRRGIFVFMNKVMQNKAWALIDYMQWLSKIPMSLISKALMPILKVAGIGLGLLKMTANPFISNYISLSGYNRENMADKFAAMHGYGPEFATGITKMTMEPIGTEEVINRIPILGHMYGLVLVMYAYVFSFSDPHQILSARLRSIAEVLEGDLDRSDIDGKTKKQIRNDIKRMESTLDNIESEKKIGYSKQVELGYYKLMARMFPDYGDFFRGVLNDRYTNNKTVNDGVESIKKNSFDKMKIR